MKNKFIFLILVIGLLFLSSCDANISKEIKTTYKEADLETISLYVTRFDVTLDLSKDTDLKELLLSLKIYEDNSNVTYEEFAEYILYFGNYEFTIYGYKSITYIDNDIEYDAFTSDNEFDYLNTLFDFNELNFDSYTAEQSIKVYNAKDATSDITDKEEFLNNLKQVKYIKLNNKDSFSLGDLKYKIQIDDETIEVYEKFLVINNNLYLVTSGSVSFLDNLKFNTSSGWLPWI